MCVCLCALARARLCMRAIRFCSRIGRRRPEYSRIVLETAVPPLLEQLVHAPDPEAATGGSPAGGEVAEVAGVERACSVLVELCELSGVFAVAAPALLAGKIVVVMCVCGHPIKLPDRFSSTLEKCRRRSGVTDTTVGTVVALVNIISRAPCRTRLRDLSSIALGFSPLSLSLSLRASNFIGFYLLTQECFRRLKVKEEKYVPLG